MLSTMTVTKRRKTCSGKCFSRSVPKKRRNEPKSETILIRETVRNLMLMTQTLTCRLYRRCLVTICSSTFNSASKASCLQDSA